MINVVCGIRSTGRICTDLATALEAEGHEVKIAYGRETVPEQFQKYAVRIGTDMDVKLHGAKARLLDNQGCGSITATKRFLKWADEYNPDLLWLHNIHGYYLNYPLLFQWIKQRPDMKVKWTLHDCWAFTGHCVHFSYVKCNQWKTQCTKCVQKNTYPKSILVDNCRQNFRRKKAAFCGVKNMEIICVSKWLATLVKQSFLKEYPVIVEYNKVDTNIFKPTKSSFRVEHHLEDKNIILGVASVWSERKGLNDILQLGNLMNNYYVLVLVGISEKQKRNIPENILCIPRTNSTRELAEIYSAADVFVNPSYEETFGMTTVEAISCGTPAVVYKGTACEEIIDIYGGKAVNSGAERLYQAISEICEKEKIPDTDKGIDMK